MSLICLAKPQWYDFLKRTLGLFLLICSRWRRDKFESVVTRPAQGAGNLYVVPLHFFGSTSTISRFAERFRGRQYSLVSFLFDALLTVLPCPAICKSGGGAETSPLIIQFKDLDSIGYFVTTFMQVPVLWLAYAIIRVSL